MRQLAGLLVLACLFTAVPAAAHTYRGETRGGGRIVMRTALNGSTLIVLRAQRELRCRKGSLLSFRQGGFRQSRPFVRNSGGGVFRGSVRTRGPSGSLIRLGRFSIRARITGTRAVGVLRERTRLKDGTRCTSGRVRFSIPLISTNAGG